MSDTGWETYSADIVLASCKRCTFTMTDCGDVPCPVCTCDTLRTRAETAERQLAALEKMVHEAAWLYREYTKRECCELVAAESDRILATPSTEAP